MCAVAPVLRELRSRPPAPAPEGTDEEPFPVPRDIGKRLWPRLRAIALVRDGHLCRACGRDLTALPAWYTEVHHIRPRVEGGSDHPANLATLCVECHGELTDGLRRRMRSTAAIAGPGPF
jgi:5-methylcytosine-specific restriction protein A